MNTEAQSATLRPYVRSAEPDNSFWYLGQLMSALAEGEDTGGTADSARDPLSP